jgi:hypothetical protein
MAEFFTAEYKWVWAALMTVALFFPVRQFIWVLSVRRAEAKSSQPTDDAEKARLKKRAGFTSVLLCFLFSLAYVSQMFKAPS